MTEAQHEGCPQCSGWDSNLDRLYEILKMTTQQLRKQQETVVKEQIGNVKVTHLYAMPHEDEVPNIEKVDCHFITVGVDKAAAEAIKDELVEILKTYPEPERLAGGPSYIELGAEIGDQGTAFQLFALGQVLGLWKVITPAVLGLKGPEADMLAGSGLIMCSGFKLKGEENGKTS